MVYYAVAMTVTLILCYYNTTVYPLPNGAEAKCFRNWRTAFLVLLPLTFVAVFRWNVGWDSLYGSSYWEAYHASADGLNPREFEFGFFWFMRLFAELEVPYFWFLFALASLFMACVSYAISKGSVWTRWSILIFFLLAFYFDSYSSLRQSLAEAISLIGWAYMGYLKPSKKKDLLILAAFFIASLFHQIALINIPVYLICRIRFSRDGAFKFLVAALILSPVLQIILRLATALFASSYTPGSVARINTLMTGVLAALCWYFYDEISSIDDTAYMYVNLGICTFVLLLNSGAMPIPYRVFDMLKISYVFIIPYLLRGIKKRRTRLSVEVAMVFIFGLWFYNYFFIQDPSSAHYQSAFSDWNTIIHLP